MKSLGLKSIENELNYLYRVIEEKNNKIKQLEQELQELRNNNKK